jgi:hypothetical protein
MSVKFYFHCILSEILFKNKDRKRIFYLSKTKEFLLGSRYSFTAVLHLILTCVHHFLGPCREFQNYWIFNFVKIYQAFLSLLSLFFGGREEH